MQIIKPELWLAVFEQRWDCQLDGRKLKTVQHESTITVRLYLAGLKIGVMGNAYLTEEYVFKSSDERQTLTGL